VDTVLSGAATVEQLESNLDALNVDPAKVVGLETLMPEDPESYWNTRSGLKWT
jgi:aryl-alcohol dehydrogenase-like predicted oxidoreductase